MKTNKETIESYNNFKSVLEIKHKILLTQILYKTKELNTLNNFINEIENCLFDKYSINMISKINGKLRGENVKRHIICLQLSENIDSFSKFFIQNEYKKENVTLSIIYSSDEVLKKLMSFLKGYNTKIIDIIQIDIEDKENYLLTINFLKLVTKIAHKIIKKKGYKTIELVSKINDSSYLNEKIFPIKKSIVHFVCKKFNNIKIFYPTKKIWANNLSDQLINLKIIVSILEKNKQEIIIKSLEMNENISTLDNKVYSLQKEDKNNKSIEMSDELNMMQEGENENN